VRSCPQPIVVSGGPRATTDREVLEMVRGTMDAGAVGVSIGRNIWQHSNPVAMAHAVADIVLRDADVESAMSTLKSNADAGSRAKSQGRAER
jgi:fructose-bisphosphate aldolase/2-amino-3,7-dideoxy-D-threo-hept-6-ulosonate synthase